MSAKIVFTAMYTIQANQLAGIFYSENYFEGKDFPCTYFTKTGQPIRSYELNIREGLHYQETLLGQNGMNHLLSERFATIAPNIFILPEESANAIKNNLLPASQNPGAQLIQMPSSIIFHLQNKDEGVATTPAGEKFIRIILPTKPEFQDLQVNETIHQFLSNSNIQKDKTTLLINLSEVIKAPLKKLLELEEFLQKMAAPARGSLQLYVANPNRRWINEEVFTEFANKILNPITDDETDIPIPFFSLQKHTLFSKVASDNIPSACEEIEIRKRLRLR